MTTALALLALILSLLSMGLALRARRTPPAPPAPPEPPPKPPAVTEDHTAREGLDRLAAQARETQDEIGALAERVERLEAERQVAERALGELGAQVERLETGWSKEAEELREALGLLQSSLETLTEEASQEATAEPAPEPDAETRVRAHLREAGWEDVVLLPDAPGAWRVEARRGGVLAKGRAQLFGDGRVEARLTSPTRAFP